MNIIAEVTAYLEKLDEVMPMYQMRDVLPQNTPMPEMPERPRIMEWVERVDKWGWPNPGTWMDQPWEFVQDIEAVKVARDKFIADKEAKDKLAQAARVPPDAPDLSILGSGIT